MNQKNEGQEENSVLRLTDILAIERTSLANDRTLLAYVRTALSVVIAGMTLIKFFEINYFKITGLVFVVAGFVLFYFGIVKYNIRKKEIYCKKE